MSDLFLLLLLTVLSRLLSLLLLSLSSLLPLFDASPTLDPDTSSLRWDAFHFAHIAHHRHVYEHEWAFFPAVPFILRSLSPHRLLLPAVLTAIACDSTRIMYRLSLYHLGSPSLAFLASLLSLLPSSPATLHWTPYNEPFFTYLSYKGMLCCARSQWLLAALLFTLAGIFRSNGFLLSGFILWGLLVQPYLDGNKPPLKRIIYTTFLVSLTLTPFVYHNASAYILFCTSTTAPPPSWCHNLPPSIYAHVQSKYWNVGFLRYWTLQQIPNFILAAPPLLLLYSFSIYHLSYALLPRLVTFASKSPPKSQAPAPPLPFLNPSLTPHAIHAFLLSTVLLFASHTQIILRFAASMPITYWAAAWLVAHHSKYGRAWVAWSVVWGAVSVVLWGAFLPPA